MGVTLRRQERKGVWVPTICPEEEGERWAAKPQQRRAWEGRRSRCAPKPMSSWGAENSGNSCPVVFSPVRSEAQRSLGSRAEGRGRMWGGESLEEPRGRGRELARPKVHQSPSVLAGAVAGGLCWWGAVKTRAVHDRNTYRLVSTEQNTSCPLCHWIPEIVQQG